MLLPHTAAASFCATVAFKAITSQVNASALAQELRGIVLGQAHEVDDLMI